MADKGGALPLGRRLIAAGILTREQVQAGLRSQSAHGRRLGTNLVKLGLVDVDAVSQCLGVQHGVPAALRRHFEQVDRAALALLPSQLALRHFTVPIAVAKRDGRRALLVAMRDPMRSAIAEIEVVTGCALKAMVASELAIYQALERLYGLHVEDEGRPVRPVLPAELMGDDDDAPSTTPDALPLAPPHEFLPGTGGESWEALFQNVAKLPERPSSSASETSWLQPNAWKDDPRNKREEQWREEARQREEEARRRAEERARDPARRAASALRREPPPRAPSSALKTPEPPPRAPSTVKISDAAPPPFPGPERERPAEPPEPKRENLGAALKRFLLTPIPLPGIGSSKTPKEEDEANVKEPTTDVTFAAQGTATAKDSDPPVWPAERPAEARAQERPAPAPRTATDSDPPVWPAGRASAQDQAIGAPAAGIGAPAPVVIVTGAPEGAPPGPASAVLAPASAVLAPASAVPAPASAMPGSASAVLAPASAVLAPASAMPGPASAVPGPVSAALAPASAVPASAEPAPVIITGTLDPGTPLPAALLVPVASAFKAMADPAVAPVIGALVSDEDLALGASAPGIASHAPAWPGAPASQAAPAVVLGAPALVQGAPAFVSPAVPEGAQEVAPPVDPTARQLEQAWAAAIEPLPHAPEPAFSPPVADVAPPNEQVPAAMEPAQAGAEPVAAVGDGPSAEAAPAENAAAPVAEAAAPAEPFDARAAIERAQTREEVGAALTEYLRATFGCGLVLIVRNEVAFGWRGFAPGIETDLIESITVPLRSPSMLSLAHESKALYRGPLPAENLGVQARLFKMLGMHPPDEVVVAPVVLGGRVVNLLYAHSLDRTPLLDSAVADLGRIAGLAATAFLRIIRAQKEAR